jgi:hypothetical protein
MCNTSQRVKYIPRQLSNLASFMWSINASVACAVPNSHRIMRLAKRRRKQKR